jgi:serine/threonine protein kinase
MELRVKCSKCGAKHKVAGEKLKGRRTQFKCKRCSEVIVIEADAVEKAQVEQEQGQTEQIRGKSDKKGDSKASEKDAVGGPSPFEAGIPTSFGKYQDLKRLASGGMGDVYLARLAGAEGFEREVILKVLHPHLARDENFSQTLVDEAKITVLLNHPNIVQMYNLERTNDLLYCVMEYVPGEPLSAIQRMYRRKGGAIPIAMAIYIAAQALEGLAYAHDLSDREGKKLGIVHRDISPQNILVTRDGWVKVIDFGIAKAATRANQTRTGTIKGKFAYMAPEQFKGQSDHKVDLFAMGVVLWEMLAGIRLFHGSTDVDTFQRVLNLEPPPISENRPGTPKEIDLILKRAMSKDPNKRYRTAREFRADLLQFVAPATIEELRASVDIDASQLGSAVSPISEETLFENYTPSVPDSKTEYDSDKPAGKAAAKSSSRWVIWFVALLVLIPATVAGTWYFLKNQQQNNNRGNDNGSSKVASMVKNDVPVNPPKAVVDGGTPTAPDGGTAVETTKAAASENAEEATKEVESKKKKDNGKKKVASYRKKIQKAVKLDGKMINRILAKNYSKLQKCATAQLAKELGKDINLVLDFTISMNGAVIEADIRPPKVKATDFGRCLLNQVRRIKFPKHKDLSIRTSLPLKFQVFQ